MHESLPYTEDNHICNLPLTPNIQQNERQTILHTAESNIYLFIIIYSRDP
jgi:hypothetical protein